GDEVIVDNEDVVKTDKETRSVVEKVTTAEETISAATTTITDDETTLSKALAELKSAKPSVGNTKSVGHFQVIIVLARS
ncbi:hypothetical protein Tco_0509935, partial [Tanacetum coccineum]